MQINNFKFQYTGNKLTSHEQKVRLELKFRIAEQHNHRSSRASKVIVLRRKTDEINHKNEIPNPGKIHNSKFSYAVTDPNKYTDHR